jgi:AbrB family looped-hinge helix DNA binding protein
MNDAAVSSSGQIRLPARIRKKYGMAPGTRVRLIERDNDIVVQPVALEAIRSLHGCLKSPTSATAELLKMRAEDKKREDAKADKIRSL